MMPVPITIRSPRELEALRDLIRVIEDELETVAKLYVRNEQLLEKLLRAKALRYGLAPMRVGDAAWLRPGEGLVEALLASRSVTIAIALSR